MAAASTSSTDNSNGAYQLSGSRRRKSQNRKLEIEGASKQIDRGFFYGFCGETPLFSEFKFARKYRMPSEFYEKLRVCVKVADRFS